MNFKKINTNFVFLVIQILVLSDAWSQDITKQGGDLTNFSFPLDILLEIPAPNVTDSERFDKHLSGHGDFHNAFNDDVVGPKFNHNSCGGCHFKDGRGQIKFSKNATGSPMLVKVSMRGLKFDGSPQDVPDVGEQLRDHDINGKILHDIKLKWEYVRGSYPDGTRYKLRKPILTYKIPNVNLKKVVSSLRMTPPIIGMGLLEAVPDTTLEEMSDPIDRDGDGISGELSIVPDLETNLRAYGRFGFRATHVNLKQQSAAAFFNDMGMTNEVIRDTDIFPEVSEELMSRVVLYQQIAGVPPARDQSNPNIIAGKELFQRINCSGCHKMTLRTGNSAVPEVANQEFHPFTDLLLHDMGRGLSDKRPEFTASGREWRTSPLWGLGTQKVISKARTGYLHDGRARNLEEAILWHDGEAADSRKKFKDLSKKERTHLIEFLNSL